MGSLFGGGDAKKAAKISADATRAAARAATMSANYQAESAAQQIQLSQEQRSASQAAADLLSTPMESASVDLAADPNESEYDGDLLSRRRSTRQSYQAGRKSGLSV